MAAQRPIVVDSGTVLRKVVHGKQSRKHPGKPIAPLPPATVHGAELNPAKVGPSGEATAAFDPRVFLNKFAVGKNSREYQGNESIFSQGDAADAVFYIQSGKVKVLEAKGFIVREATEKMPLAVGQTQGDGGAGRTMRVTAKARLHAVAFHGVP